MLEIQVLRHSFHSKEIGLAGPSGVRCREESVSMLVSRKPRFSVEDACRIAAVHYGIEKPAATELSSERDQNFRIEDSEGRPFVLKIANPDESPDVIDLQNQALFHLERSSVRCLVPSLRPSVRGDFVISVPAAAGSHQVRLVTFLEGLPMGAATDVPGHLLIAVGELLGRIDRVLAGFSHPAMKRHLYWDSRHALKTIGGNRLYLRDPNRLELLDRFVTSFREQFLPVAGALGLSVIHNDANDYNLLVNRATGPSELTGLIDFGDMVRTYTACEVANACAYLMMGSDSPVGAASQIVCGYQRGHPLSEFECRILGHLIAIRLCLSVSNSARQREQAPENEYLTISERPAWALLETLSDLDLEEFGETMVEVASSSTA